MTHLILDTQKYVDSAPNQGITQRIVTRSGKPITFVYTGFFEKETTFNGMNEFFRLCILDQVDQELRKTGTSKIRDNIVLLVDNGHGEDPDSPLTKMCMMRVLLLLNVTSITQRAFAEYHSKKNFVERVHASENAVLSAHGPFNSHQKYKETSLGSKEHRENMEMMANDVIECLKMAKFNKQSLIALRGNPSTRVFNDEKRLKEFLELSEENKASCGWTYTVEDSNLLQTLSVLWGCDVKFKRKYYDDYVSSNNMSGKKTAWLDKYSTTLFNPRFKGT